MRFTTLPSGKSLNSFQPNFFPPLPVKVSLRSCFFSGAYTASNPTRSVLSNGPAEYHFPSRFGSPWDFSVARTVSERVSFLTYSPFGGSLGVWASETARARAATAAGGRTRRMVGSRREGGRAGWDQSTRSELLPQPLELGGERGE